MLNGDLPMTWVTLTTQVTLFYTFGVALRVAVTGEDNNFKFDGDHTVLLKNDPQRDVMVGPT